MRHSVIEMTRAVRRRLERVVRNSREKDYARRALAVLHLWETQGNVAEVAHRVRAARSSVYRWLSLYETYGEDGLRPQARGRSDWKATEELLSMHSQSGRADGRRRLNTASRSRNPSFTFFRTLMRDVGRGARGVNRARLAHLGALSAFLVGLADRRRRTVRQLPRAADRGSPAGSALRFGAGDRPLRATEADAEGGSGEPRVMNGQHTLASPSPEARTSPPLP